MAEPPRVLFERDRALVRLTQDDLPLVEAPFAALAEQGGVAERELLEWLQEMRRAGVLRRFAAILRHQRAGFAASGMAVWEVPDEHLLEAGRRGAAFPQVSHCYQRPTYPDWPYNLFTLIHARTREKCEALAQRLAAELAPLGGARSAILYAVKEYKKERVKFFLDF